MDKVQQSISAWKELGFEDLQKLLDEQGLKISEYSTAGSATRKELSSKTKEFRKLEDEEKLKQHKSLLKMYQQEIDTLTNRTKFAESCFLSVYKQLAEAPNPLPLLELGASAGGELETLRARNRELSEQLAQQSDYQSLKKQLANQEKLIAQHVQAKQTELEAYWDERQKGWKSREQELIKSNDEYRSEIAILENKLERGGEGQEAATSRSAQVTALERELERSQVKIASLDARVADLRGELEKERNAHKDTSQQLALENENTKLASRVERLQSQLTAATSSYASERQDLETKLDQARTSLQQAQKRVAQQSDYDQLRKELEFLRQIEFGGEDTAGSGENSEAMDILKQKNTKLQDDLKNLRISNGKLTTENDGLQQSLTAIQEQLKSSRQMVERLEGDLSTMSRDETFSTISGWTAIPRRTSPASSIRGAGAGAGGGPGPISVRGEGTSGAPISNDVLTIITQQRDRYKDRASELEEDLHRCKNSVTSLTKDLEALKIDNRDLYTQLRQHNKAGSDRFKGVYNEEMSNFHTVKSLGLDRPEGNPADQVFFAIVKKTVMERGYRYGVMGWAILVHLLLLWLSV